ncbi:hypothetical protein Taro_001496 [Colocasia esculenta]|uniref:Uncharacterized protein n=1 Tax=Colocasia esculenta TaxID=4460 RepID=A0A843TIA3_COLES|nr:hypothetical protein [Colocasia esculenta]
MMATHFLSRYERDRVRCGRLSLNLTASGLDVNPLAVQIGGEGWVVPCRDFGCFGRSKCWIVNFRSSGSVRRCEEMFHSINFMAVRRTMAPRRRPREGVAEQATRQETGDSPPPQQKQPLPQDAHSGIVLPPPPPPPQAAQGLDLTRFLEGMAPFLAQHRDAPVPQGGTGNVLREFLQFQPPQFLGQPDPDIARAWLDAVERTFRSMECVPKERVLLASYQL